MQLHESPQQSTPLAPRPAIVHGHTIEATCGCGTLTVTINLNEHGHPFEVFLKDTKAQPCAQTLLDTLAIALSIALRAGVSPTTLMANVGQQLCEHSKPESYATAIAAAFEQIPSPSLFSHVGTQRSTAATTAPQSTPDGDAA